MLRWWSRRTFGFFAASQPPTIACLAAQYSGHFHRDLCGRYVSHGIMSGTPLPAYASCQTATRVCHWLHQLIRCIANAIPGGPFISGAECRIYIADVGSGVTVQRPSRRYRWRWRAQSPIYAVGWRRLFSEYPWRRYSERPDKGSIAPRMITPENDRRSPRPANSITLPLVSSLSPRRQENAVIGCQHFDGTVTGTSE